MSPRNTTQWLAWAAVVAAAWGLPASAEDLLHARIGHESGGALVRGSEDADWSYATINTIILPGDTLWIDQEGTLEVEMSGGSFLRMADRSKAELQQLPPSASINAWTGSFYVQRVARSTGDVKLRTPAATINIDRDTQVRVDVVGQGSTTVSVRWGRATVVAEGGPPIEAANGQRVYIDPGLLPSNPVPFDKTVEDSFDAWNRERARLLALGDTALPTSVRVEQTPIGYSDLASYGEWVYVDNRQYWRPTVVYDYVPFRDGYWSYAQPYGYSWTGAYPFCYVTSHYGRWNYYPAYGWLWCYSPTWSPAWCATAYYGGNMVWCPLDYYDRPCRYGTTFYVGGIPFSVSYSSYCHAPDLYYGPCSVYPAYGDLFVNVNVGDIYVWNIYSNTYPHKYPHYGSTALYRDYNPRRVIRGIESGGAFTVAASHRARALNSELGRTEFAVRSTDGPRSVRTSQVSTARHAQVRSASLNRDATALDTGSVIRRGQGRIESLRGADDAKPQVSEARRARVASLERSASDVAGSKLPGAASRMSSARSLRTTDGDVDTVRGRGGRSESADGNGATATVEASVRGRASSSARVERSGAATHVTEPTVPSARPTERAIDREARRLDTDSQRRVITDTTAQGRSSSATSRTLDDTRARINAPEGTVRSQGANQTRVREPNVPRISGGDGRNERSEPLGTIPQVPQRSRSAYNPPVQTFTPEPASPSPHSRVIRDTSRDDRMRDSAPAYTQPPAQIEAPRVINEAPRARFEAPQQRFEAPQVNIPQRFETPQPRFEAPQQRFEAPQINMSQRFETPQPRFEAPQARVEPPQPRFEAPQINVPQRFEAPQHVERSQSFGGGESRFGSRSDGDGGGRGRSR